MAAVPEPRRFEVERDGQVLAGEVVDSAPGSEAGPTVVLLHAITATRDGVVHGSNMCPRRGDPLVTYDARGHGESSPAPEGQGYSYDELVADAEAVLDEAVGEERVVLGGSSMGAHTAVAFALRHPERLAGLVVIGPAYNGVPPSEESLREWDALADGLERDGVEGFMRAYEAQLRPSKWRDALLRFTRERLEKHRHPDAVARAMRETTRDLPFEEMGELEFIEVPALVVASNDEADPGHPYAVAEAYAERLPRARLISEEEGESPLAWQGGKLSREIAAFAQQDAVGERAR
jgi:pimeloyl-ACP methyl ester carboxylesterase